MHKAQGSTAREDARQRGRLLAAEISGAIEGLLESIEKYELERNVEDAAQQAQRLTTSTTEELRRQAHAPESQELGQDVRRGAEAVGQTAQEAFEDTAQTVGDGWRRTTEAVGERWEQTTEAVEERVDTLKRGARHATDRAEHAAETVVDETKARSQNLARAGRRAKRAPGAIMHDMKQAAGARAKGMASGIGLFALAGLVALTGFIVFTIAAVNGMNAVAGAPEGAFLVALLYVLGAAGIGYGAIKARQKAQEEAAAHMRDVRYELQNVARPLRRVFSTRRVTPPREEIEPQEPEFEYTHWNRR